MLALSLKSLLDLIITTRWYPASLTVISGNDISVQLAQQIKKNSKRTYSGTYMHATDFNDPTILTTEGFSQLGDEVICGTLDFDVGYLV